jgi:type IV fimbrial biogenesis protein FimT
VLIMRSEFPVIAIRRARGFTLVEMVVVMALTALILFVAVPGVGEWLRNVRVRSTAESIASGVAEARMEAIRRNQVVSFWLVNSPGVTGVLDASCVRAASSPSWIVSLDDPTSLCHIAPSIIDAPRTVSSHAAGPNGEGVVIAGLDANDSSASSVAFNGYGQPVTGVGGTPIATIDVSAAVSGARRLRIVINTGGDVRMCDRDVAITDPRRCL